MVTKRNLVLAAAGFVGMVVLLRVLFIWLPNNTYKTLTGNPNFINRLSLAAENDNQEEFKQLAKDYQIKYQKFTKGRLDYSSDKNLPLPKIITQDIENANILLPSQETLYKVTRPYRGWIKGRPYIFFPYVPHDTDRTYLIYKQVRLLWRKL